MRIAIATVKVPFVRGGAEVLADGLERALLAAGHEIEQIQIPFKWYPPERILDHLLACRLLDITEASGTKIDMMIGLKFPAYLIPHDNKVLWIVHQHRQAYDLWDRLEGSDLNAATDGASVRSAIREADRTLIPEAKKVFTIARNVSDRLMKFCGIGSQPLYHPPYRAEDFFQAEAEDYFFYPSRISRLKRQELVLQALALTRNPVRMLFAGSPEYAPDLESLKRSTIQLGLRDRVSWLGPISDDLKIEYYAKALGVVFPPVDEDYGYVTLEAMLAAKPVITCNDSGEPTQFVVNNETGLVVDPSPRELATAMDRLWENRSETAKLGKFARERYDLLGISWGGVVSNLLG